MSILMDIGRATRDGDQHLTAELVRKALEEGVEVERIIEEAFLPAMAQVGQEFADGVRYIPEMLLAARAMQTGMEVLKPRLAGGKLKAKARVVLGTVAGDLHDIGKNLVAMMMEGAGVEVIDLGIDVPPERFVEAVKDHRPDFVAMSALLTTTMPAMRETIEALEEAGLRQRVKVLIGGAPVSQKYAVQIGADGYGANANDAVRLIKETVV